MIMILSEIRMSLITTELLTADSLTQDVNTALIRIFTTTELDITTPISEDSYPEMLILIHSEAQTPSNATSMSRTHL